MHAWAQVLERADPHSNHYGAWLSPEEVREYVRAPAASVKAVRDWLRAAGLRGELNFHRDVVTVHNITIAQVAIIDVHRSLWTSMVHYIDHRG